jgi:hypothetical protein
LLRIPLFACSAPPKGRARWTLTLLEIAVTELDAEALRAAAARSKDVAASRRMLGKRCAATLLPSLVRK